MLDRQPLPTYEEAMLASFTKSIAKEGLNFFDNSMLHSTNESILSNSPLFATLNTVTIYHFGTNLFSFRILGLLFSVFTLILLFNYFGEFEKGSFKNASFLILVAFMIDPILNQHLHANGNIAMGVFFILLSLIKEFKKTEHNFISTINSSFLVTLALLSYLPIVFILPFLILFKTISAFTGLRDKKTYLFSHLSIWITAIVILYSIWLIYSGLNFYILIEKIGSTTHEPIETLYLFVFLILATIALLGYNIFQRKYTIENKFIILLLFGICISYFAPLPIFQNNTLFLLPFLYLINFGLLPLNITDNYARIGRYLPILILLIFNCTIFFIQSVNIIADYQNRSDEEIQKFITKYIPKGQKTVSDARPSMVLLSSKYSTITIKSSLSLNETIKNSDIKYAIISEDFERNNGYSSSTLEYGGFKKMAKIKYEPSKTHQLLSSIGLVPANEDKLYSIQIFKRN